MPVIAPRCSMTAAQFVLYGEKPKVEISSFQLDL